MDGHLTANGYRDPTRERPQKSRSKIPNMRYGQAPFLNLLLTIDQSDSFQIKRALSPVVKRIRPALSSELLQLIQ